MEGVGNFQISLDLDVAGGFSGNMGSGDKAGYRDFPGVRGV
jgi:hypothetical protein